MLARPVLLALVFVSGIAPLPAWQRVVAAASKSQVTLRVTDQETGELLPVRMHLKDPKGKPVKPPKVPYWNDHFVFGGELTLTLAPGKFTYELEHGPEYKLRTGGFTLERGSEGQVELQMERFADMRKEGWWSGDLHVHRPLGDVPLLMQAEDLHVAPVITWWNDRNEWETREPPATLLNAVDGQRFYHAMAGEDERQGGALLYFQLERPLPLPGSQKEFPEHPSPVEFLKMAHQHPGVHVDIEKPFWWDMPVWIASGRTHTLGICHNHMCRDTVLATEAWGKPRDKTLYPDPHGNGRWTQDIYYHLLNCGLRVPPSAGSASGVLPNPVGYNRVYVHCGADFTWEKWWEGLRAGQVVVTNGPLLRPRVNGQLPGHVFTAQDGSTVMLQIHLELALREQVEYLEIIQNGKKAHEVPLRELADKQGKLPPVKFDSSGWMLIRAVTNNTKTFRFGSTGPYYVEIGGKPRISRQSAEFFVNWVDERTEQIRLADESQQREVLQYHEAAREFWQKILDSANVQ